MSSPLGVKSTTKLKLHLFFSTVAQGILWYGMEYGMEGKNRYGIWNGIGMGWKI